MRTQVGINGSPTIRTRAVDRMAAEGLKFTQFYSAAPICTPSRGAMLTGRLPIRSGLYTNLDYPVDLAFRVFYPSSVGCLPNTEVTMANALKSAGKHDPFFAALLRMRLNRGLFAITGYYSALIGKWHLGHNSRVGCLPVDRGFDYFYGLPYSHEEGQ